MVARSYTDLYEQSKVQIDGWTYHPKFLRPGDKVLFVDDIFDSGHTINYLVNYIMEKGVARSSIRIAVHDYKRSLDRDIQPIQPDYWCREIPMDNEWAPVHGYTIWAMNWKGLLTRKSGTSTQRTTQNLHQCLMPSIMLNQAGMRMDREIFLIKPNSSIRGTITSQGINSTGRFAKSHSTPYITKNSADMRF